MGLKCKIFGHKWNDCKCLKCGKVRDEQHDWDECHCKICGKIKENALHNWNGCLCSRCSKIRDEQHDWEFIRTESDVFPGNPDHFIDKEHIYKCKTCGMEERRPV